MTGASTPYATRELAGTLVRQAIVAEKGVSATVWTSSMVGGGTVGGAGDVVVAVGGGGVVDAAAPGRARNLRSLTYGELNAISAEPVADDTAARVIVWALTLAMGVKPALVAPPVSRPTARTGRPVGGANLSGGFAAAGAAEAGAEAESDPGMASLKPIAEPATTASSSQRVARRGTR